jgi:hypothetical protein
MPRKATLSADGIDIPNLVGPGRLASTTSAVVDTAQDEMKTVQETSPATKKRSVDVIDDSKDVMKVSRSNVDNQSLRAQMLVLVLVRYHPRG